MLGGVLIGLNERPPSEEQRVFAADFDQWCRFIHELIESRPDANFVWYDDGCANSH